jgi:putative ABC transport system permease protein
MTQKAIGAAFRNLRRAPAFTGLVVLTLALGIGATTAMFSVVDAVLINPLPFPNADRVLEIWTLFEEGSARAPGATSTVVRTIRDEQDLFESVSAYQFGSGTLTDAGDPELLSFAGVSPSIFGLFPAVPLAGRLFTAADAASSERVMLLGERLWSSKFGRDPSIIGRVLTIDDQQYRVVGVLPSRFNFPESSVDAWRPLDVDSEGARVRIQMVGLRRADVTKQAIDDRLKTLTASLRASGALPAGQYLVTDEPVQVRYGRSGSNALYLLLGAVGVLLLIACVNVSNLMLVRASSRHGELAIMAAVGAGRSRLLRDAAVESFLLALAGGALGIWLASGLLDVILGLVPDQMRMLSRATGALDLRAVVFALATTMTTCLACGMLPAWRTSRIDPVDAIKHGARSLAGRRDDWWQGALVSTQIALVAVLLAGAGLLLRSFIKLNQVDLGFDPNRMVVLELQLTQPRYTVPGAALTLMREIESRVEAQVGVPVTIGNSPVRGGAYSFGVRPEAEGFTPPSEPIELPSSRVSPDYFEVYQIPILDGRALTAEDGDTAIVLNEVIARRYFGNQSPIGRRFKLNTPQPWLTVVGVARDVKTMGPSDPIGQGMEVYLGYQTAPRTYNFLTLSAAAGANPEAALQRIRRIVWDVDARVPILSAITMREQVGSAISRPRFVLSLSAAFTICAVVIAAVGVYGVSAYWVARRRRELAIRIAMGASPNRVIRTVLGRSARLAAAGAVAGLMVSLGGAQVMQSLLFATDPRDPATFFGVTVVLGVVAIAACAIPAIKASRVDPMTTLRAE